MAYSRFLDCHNGEIFWTYSYNDVVHDNRFITDNILFRTVAICLFCNLYNNPCPFITQDRTTLNGNGSYVIV